MEADFFIPLIYVQIYPGLRPRALNKHKEVKRQLMSKHLVHHIWQNL